jgi:hypothetical protein
MTLIDACAFKTARTLNNAKNYVSFWKMTLTPDQSHTHKRGALKLSYIVASILASDRQFDVSSYVSPMLKVKRQDHGRAQKLYACLFFPFTRCIGYERNSICVI